MKPGQLQWVVTFSMFFFFSTSTTVLSCVSAPPGLMGWWSAEGNANDSIGGNNGTLVNGVSFTNGMVGQAFSLNGTSSYVSIPDSSLLDALTTNITIEAWIKVNQFPDGSWTAIVTKGDSSWRLHRYSDGSTISFGTSGLSNADLVGNKDVNDGQWHHVAGVYDGTNKFLYVDGVLDVSTPATGSIAQNNYPVCIGENAQQTGRLWNGLIDEVSIYNRALTAAEIQSIYNAGSSGKCPVPPKIIIAPTNQTVAVSDTASFSITASGTPPLIYQWSFNGTNIPVATNATLTLTNVQLNQAGNYAVLVTNAYGFVSSNAMLMVVDSFPVIVSQPTNQTVMVGDMASFSITATGALPLAYRWYFNGMPLSDGGSIVGSTAPTLLISNGQTNDSGLYQVVVTNNYGMITSTAAMLALKVQITGQPSSQGVFPGSNVTFTVTAIGTLPLGYQWFFNGTALAEGGRISGSTSPTLNILNVQNSDFGDYTVVVTNYLSATTSSTASLALLSVRYVNVSNSSPASPYTSWITAATNIQDAVDAAVNGDQILVTNGVYQTGGQLIPGDATTNRVAVNKPVTVQSVNGPTLTVIQGYQVPGSINGDGAIRCVYLVSGATLVGFTLTGGATTQTSYEGGGILCPLYSSAVVSNCIITGNSAYYDAGGAEGCTLNNCTISGNNAASGGGGVFGGTLNNCIVSGNSASSGGGAFSSSLNRCIISGNSAWDGGGGSNCRMNNCLISGNIAVGNHGGGAAFQGGLINCTVVGNQCNSFYGGVGGGTFNSSLNNCVAYYNTSWGHPYSPNYIGGSLNNCCTTPLPSGGTGNFTYVPLFVDQGGGDFHLQSNSPCINAGNNAYVTTTNDLDGNLRIKGGTVDIGAYEYQTPTSVISYVWLQQYGLTNDGAADYADADGDGMNNWQEWKTGTDPTNLQSVLKMASAVATNNPPGMIVTWQSVNTRTYYLQRSTNLTAQPAFSTIQSDIVGLAGTTSYTDAAATNGGPYFYRVGVQ